MPIPSTPTQTQPALVMPMQHPVNVPSQDGSLQTVPRLETASPLPNVPAPIRSAPLPDTTSVPEASPPSTPMSSAPMPSASEHGPPNPGTSVSDSTLHVPGAPVLGAPENVRISTKRTETLIKVRWQPSSIYPEATACYELEMHPMMSFKVLWKVVATTNKLSAKVTHLQPDTSYEFRVRAMNAEGTSSPYSETVTGSTKASKGAGGGGTVAVSRSAYSGLSKLAASGSSLFGSSKLKGRNPSGVGEYVFGGLSRGIKSAGDYLGNKAKVEEEPISPQSSDDEQ